MTTVPTKQDRNWQTLMVYSEGSLRADVPSIVLCWKEQVMNDEEKLLLISKRVRIYIKS
jgi:hypothetical protein